MFDQSLNTVDVHPGVPHSAETRGGFAQRRRFARKRFLADRLANQAQERTTLLDFFFQAEDGIRDKLVTGVQTCALPISAGRPCARTSPRRCTSAVLGFTSMEGRPQKHLALIIARELASQLATATFIADTRSEERRVGKECRSRRSPAH